MPASTTLRLINLQADLADASGVDVGILFFCLADKCADRLDFAAANVGGDLGIRGHELAGRARPAPTRRPLAMPKATSSPAADVDAGVDHRLETPRGPAGWVSSPDLILPDQIGQCVALETGNSLDRQVSFVERAQHVLLHPIAGRLAVAAAVGHARESSRPAAGPGSPARRCRRRRGRRSASSRVAQRGRQLAQRRRGPRRLPPA